MELEFKQGAVHVEEQCAGIVQQGRWRATMWDKQAGHGMDEKSFRRPARSMGAIGG